MGPNILLLGLEVLLRTTGDVLHVMSMLVLLFKIRRTRSCSGISLKSQILYICVYGWRYVDLIYVGLYPKYVMRSFRMVYNTIMKCLFIGLQSHIIYNIVNKYYYSYDLEFDVMPLWVLLVPAVVGGGFLTLPGNWSRGDGLQMGVDWLWAASVILESVSIVPQLVLLQNAGEGESLTVYYVVFMGLYRLFYLVSWLVKWLNDMKISQLLLLSSVVQTLLYTNFFSIYIQSFIAKGKSLRLYPPTFVREAFGIRHDRKE
ncbi:ER lumen protein retaining receptor [Nematocida homosporus]|uniref:ER lumen protein retaining receptor n=1 Tax=Nematocida homosporus TaxID=1912981 RepID=UPI002220E231|nr:ER lumen protein retaining receptor [Nematocida homosporus]KAI5188088.1 ER lumen protein retaining receptor [Nematocida homosporus]